MRCHQGDIDARTLDLVRIRRPQHGHAHLTRCRAGAATRRTPGTEQQVQSGQQQGMHMFMMGTAGWR